MTDSEKKLAPSAASPRIREDGCWHGDQGHPCLLNRVAALEAALSRAREWFAMALMPYRKLREEILEQIDDALGGEAQTSAAQPPPDSNPKPEAEGHKAVHSVESHDNCDLLTCEVKRELTGLTHGVGTLKAENARLRTEKERAEAVAEGYYRSLRAAENARDAAVAGEGGRILSLVEAVWNSRAVGAMSIDIHGPGGFAAMLAAIRDGAPAVDGITSGKEIFRQPEHTRECYDRGAAAAANGTEDPGCTCDVGNTPGFEASEKSSTFRKPSAEPGLGAGSADHSPEIDWSKS